jgi:hypothetical protein
VFPVVFAVAEVTIGTAFCTVSLNVTKAVDEATLTVEIITGFVFEIVAGGVYRPLLLMVPFVASPPVTPLLAT